MEPPQEVREITSDNFFCCNPITEKNQFILLFENYQNFLFPQGITDNHQCEWIPLQIQLTVI